MIGIRGVRDWKIVEIREKETEREMKEFCIGEELGG